ncbi:putative bifunctional diguanylate cyclase/phosphodiesterase [Fimbriimonas ginsengisoli]|uniref:putative bifunctional diguanylate cyclase/phosphodiesterase n=1 Tax=Fimbriimonas ginsengisoli TaxID=1005039 RepID=UPI00046D92DB|nr:EAL domain-containing protein [Fimbriimonas ginsengisoli]
MSERAGPPQTRKLWLLLSVLLVAAILGVGLLVLDARSHTASTDGLRIAALRTDGYRMLTVLDGGALGRSIKPYPELRKKIDGSLSSLQASNSEAKSVATAFRSFLSASATQVAALEKGDLVKSRKVANSLTVPAFARAERAMDELDRQAPKSLPYPLALKAAGTVLLLSSAFTVALLLGRRQKLAMHLINAEAQRRSADTSERRFRSLVRNNADVIAVANAEGKLKLVSEASERLWGRPPDELVGESIYRYTFAEDVVYLVDALNEVSRSSQSSTELEVRVQNGSTEYRPFQVHLNNLSDDPDVDGILMTFHDLTERKRLESELTYNAFHDRLTGLPNRALFMDRLAQRLRLEGREPSLCAVLFIDLDNFKVINDSLGHATGDSLLVAVAERFQTVLRQSDTIARLGGDEFTVLLDRVETPDEVNVVASRIIKAMERAFVVGNSEMFVTTSIGIATSADGQADAHRLLRDADTAMYEAKAQGKNSFAIYDNRMNELAVERLELEWDLRNALDHKQLSLVFQPIVDIRTGKMLEVEALLRWEHPTRGMISPTLFIPIAEETGLICSIGLWVFREACYQLHRWGEQYKDLIIGVNVSARQFHQPDFVQQVKRTLSELRVEPCRIKLEITETAMLHDLDTIRSVLEQLRSLGLRIAIDDFGTGYSSISYLSRLPVDTLKIDRSFIIPLGEDKRTDGVVKAMIAMAASLGLQVTSEGIETPQQLEVLRSMGCDRGQGYLFARPLPAGAVAALLEESGSVLSVKA